MTRVFWDSQGVPLPNGYDHSTYPATSEADYDAHVAAPDGTEPPAPPPTVDEVEGAQWGHEGVNFFVLALNDARASRERKDYDNEAINLAIALSAA
jgi:hypothetical protein